jgi:spermidine/putrescine-binding protein
LSRFVRVGLPVLSIALVCGCRHEAESKQLRVLAWVGYDEPEYLQPISEEIGATIAVKTYVGGDQMYSLFTTAPAGTYDVVVVDAEYGERMFREQLIQALPPELWRDDQLFTKFRNGEPTRVGEDVYGSVVRWGALGLVYNTEHVTPDEASSYAVLDEPRLKGKVTIFDWYLPNMGVMSRNLGNSNAYDLDPKQLAALEGSLRRLRSQVGSIQPNTGDVINDLRTGEGWVCPGIGEWAAAVLASEGLPIAWTVPKEGGVMWVEALAIPVGCRQETLAHSFVKSARNPKNLAQLAKRHAYRSQLPVRTAYDFLTQEERHQLQAEDLTKLESVLDGLAVRKLPGPRTNEADWLRTWLAFKMARP